MSTADGNLLRVANTGKIPVLLTHWRGQDNIICNKSDTVMFLMMKLREKHKLQPEEGLFAFIGNTIITPSEAMGRLDVKYTQKNGYLKITIQKENAFGFG